VHQGGFVLIRPKMRRLLNIKKIKIFQKKTKKRKLGKAFGIVGKFIDEWDLVEVIL
jgi:hypothetical protein